MPLGMVSSFVLVLVLLLLLVLVLVLVLVPDFCNSPYMSVALCFPLTRLAASPSQPVEVLI